MSCRLLRAKPLPDGVPQGFEMDPFPLNVFINDIFISWKISLHYADNSMNYSDRNVDNLKVRLQQCTATAVNWHYEWDGR